MVQEKDDVELKELLASLRHNMMAIKSQLGVIEDTVSSCEVEERKSYYDCVGAVSMAEVEAIKFMKLNVELVNLLNRLRSHVFAKHL
jgi:hypothetical protein